MTAAAQVASLPGVVAMIARCTCCPYTLHNLLRALPADGLVAPLVSFLALAQRLPVADLWPCLRASAWLSDRHVFMDGLRLLALPLPLSLDTWQAVDTLRMHASQVAVVAKASMQDAASWHGARLVACALMGQDSDTDAHLVAVAGWMRSARSLRRVDLLHMAQSDTTAALRTFFAALPTQLETLCIANAGDPLFNTFLETQLVATVTRLALRTLRLNFLHVREPARAQAIADALHTCSTLHTLELSYGTGILQAMLHRPLPTRLRHLDIATFELHDPGPLLRALHGARLTHLSLRDETASRHHAPSDAVVHVLAVLPTMAAISHVSLTFVEASTAMAMTLSIVLPQLRQLEELRLRVRWRNETIAERALVHWLAPVLPRCRRLQRLALHNLAWDDQRWRLLDAALPHTVQYLCLDDDTRETPLDYSSDRVQVCCQRPTRMGCHLPQPAWWKTQEWGAPPAMPLL
ncbi:hypothetical protein SPRG_14592 [Saprolegnia parasitica CBS 223.65]|uniref:F-box domain-containing protein n=1 Tax=Saprolegnia parasitica (strain CBS 223.65) TaxID=695850 RepID=A0A067BZY1_SAPPC|nr:hypothetical protein SPRG_14592 [Saprolegnia parasitica CBS 223.65]KDO20112.1 hypothetical protein SPRG_14592 [Saprolegnia parasitica CBS 223.65]|eukprot:XP_012209156.1 hypothetical protein SPRG_14592 [Saprolegnia parasitica CBS 223.65]